MVSIDKPDIKSPSLTNPETSRLILASSNKEQLCGQLMEAINALVDQLFEMQLRNRIPLSQIDSRLRGIETERRRAYDTLGHIKLPRELLRLNKLEEQLEQQKAKLKTPYNSKFEELKRKVDEYDKSNCDDPPGGFGQSSLADSYVRGVRVQLSGPEDQRINLDYGLLKKSLSRLFALKQKPWLERYAPNVFMNPLVQQNLRMMPSMPSGGFQLRPR